MNAEEAAEVKALLDQIDQVKAENAQLEAELAQKDEGGPELYYWPARGRGEQVGRPKGVESSC